MTLFKNVFDVGRLKGLKASQICESNQGSEKTFVDFGFGDFFQMQFRTQRIDCIQNVLWDIHLLTESPFL